MIDSEKSFWYFNSEVLSRWHFICCYIIAGSSDISLTVRLSKQVYLIVSIDNGPLANLIAYNRQMTDFCLGVTSE